MSNTATTSKNPMEVLVVVDMQNDFVTGALANPAAEAIVENIANEIRHVRARGGHVVWTRDTHSENYLDTQEGELLPIVHCVRGTEGWNIVPELDALREEDDVIVDKPSFGSVELPSVFVSTLHDMGIEQKDLDITFVGTCTDICVVSNALMLKAWLPEAHIAVDASLCAGLTPEKHEAALETMRSCQVDVFNDMPDVPERAEITD